MLSFTNSIFLLGLAGLSVPIILHLINRELAVGLKFPSIRFIAKSDLPRKEKRKLRDLLLLLLRLLLFACLILTFSRPVWTVPSQPSSDNTYRKETVYVLDASASMRYGDSWKQALELIQGDMAASSNDAQGLVVYANTILEELSPSTDPSLIESTLNSLQPTYAAGDPRSALEYAIGLFDPDAEKRLVIVSDFQETEWQRDLPTIPEALELELLAPSLVVDANIGIVNVNTNYQDLDSARVVVSVQNFSDEEQTVLIRLVAGTEQAEKLELLPARKTVNVVFTVPVEEALEAYAELPPDVYAPDNRWHFWLLPPPVVQTYAFLPHLNEPQAASGFYFIETALQIQSPGDTVRYAVTSVDRGFFELGFLQDADFVIVPASAAYFSEYQWEDLEAYLENGGLALLLPGDGFPNQFRMLERLGLMDARFLGLAGNTNERQTPYPLAPLDSASPLAATFTGEAAKDLLLVDVYRYVRLQKRLKDTVWLSFEN